MGARLLERSARLARPTPQGQTLHDGSRQAPIAINPALKGAREDTDVMEGPPRLQAPSCIRTKHQPNGRATEEKQGLGGSRVAHALMTLETTMAAALYPSP